MLKAIFDDFSKKKKKKMGVVFMPKLGSISLYFRLSKVTQDPKESIIQSNLMIFFLKMWSSGTLLNSVTISWKKFQLKNGHGP